MLNSVLFERVLARTRRTGTFLIRPQSKKTSVTDHDFVSRSLPFLLLLDRLDLSDSLCLRWFPEHSLLSYLSTFLSRE